jgi:hypothetical protein
MNHELRYMMLLYNKLFGGMLLDLRNNQGWSFFRKFESKAFVC